MPSQWEVDVKRSDIVVFDTADIVIKPHLNGRVNAPDIEEMIQSLLRRGQIQPVSVRMENGKPVLAAGFTRWAAVSEINKRGLVPVRMKLKCIYVKMSEVEGYLLNYEENRARNSTTPMDDAHHFDQLMKWNLTIEEIAVKLNLKPTFIKDRLALIEAEPEVQAAVSGGRLKPTAAKRLAKLSAEEQRELVKRNGHKITTKEVDAATGKVSKPSLKAVRERIVEHTGHGEDGEVRAFCEEMLKFMDGTLTAV